MPESKPPPPPDEVPSAPSLHLLALRNLDSVSDPRAWGLSGDERRLYMSRVASTNLTSGDGNEYGDHHTVKMTNRLRSVASVFDQRAWSLDPDQRRRFMREMIRRSPPGSTTDLQNQELQAQLRESNMPEFMERLLSDKNQQIEELEQSVRSLAQQSMRSASAGGQSGPPQPGRSAELSSLSPNQPSPEVLRHAATSAVSDPGDLSRPDISLVQEKQERSRADSPPASEHSWGSAPTVPGSEAGGASTGSELASSAVTSSSADSIQQLKSALRRKKQLLSSRKAELDERDRSETVLATTESQQALAQETMAGQEETAGIRRHLEQLRSRLQVLNPILARLDQDYTSLADSMAGKRMAASETELRLMAEVGEMRQTIERQDAARSQLEQSVQQLRLQGVPDASPQMRSLEEQLLVTLRDMEINKLDACSKMHEASALIARAHRHSQQQEGSREYGSDPASSGYMSEMLSPPAVELPTSSPPPGSQLAPTDYGSGSESESAFESGTERSDPACHPADSKSSCPSLLDEVSGLVDINSEVERLRARINHLEMELGHRGDAPSSAADRLESERACWSQERQRLQQRIARLDAEQGRLRRQLGRAQGGDGDEARVQDAYGRFLRAESFRRALCWQKRYLMVLLGGYQETETMTLARMTQLTGGAFWPDGRRFLAPLSKFRAAAWVLVAVRRMNFMVNRWRSGRRVAGSLAAAERARSPAPSVSASSCDVQAELDNIGRIVRGCPGSTPDLHQFDARSVVTVSDVCTEDLEPYLARFDALLDRQGYPPQSGAGQDQQR